MPTGQRSNRNQRNCTGERRRRGHEHGHIARVPGDSRLKWSVLHRRVGGIVRPLAGRFPHLPTARDGCPRRDHIGHRRGRLPRVREGRDYGVILNRSSTQRPIRGHIRRRQMCSGLGLLKGDVLKCPWRRWIRPGVGCRDDNGAGDWCTAGIVVRANLRFVHGYGGADPAGRRCRGELSLGDVTVPSRSVRGSTLVRAFSDHDRDPGREMSAGHGHRGRTCQPGRRRKGHRLAPMDRRGCRGRGARGRRAAVGARTPA